MPRQRRSSLIARSIKDHLVLLFGLLGVMWAVVLLDLLPYFHLDAYGIRPRYVPGLIGIPLAPLLHAGINHVAMNSIPFITLGGIILLSGSRVFWRVTIFVTLTGGLCVWLFAPAHTNHIGASGLIFGYLGFLLSRGLFERSLVWILVAVIILLFYWSALFGVLPNQPGISWQSHLFGFLAGIGAARLRFSSGKHLLR